MSQKIGILEHVTAAATAGADLAQAGFGRNLKIGTKGETGEPMGPADVVTENDPAATIVGEENDAAKTDPDTGRAWVIDRIEGTFNLVRGFHYWTTSVAATVDGERWTADSDSMVASNGLIYQELIEAAEGLR